MPALADVPLGAGDLLAVIVDAEVIPGEAFVPASPTCYAATASGSVRDGEPCPRGRSPASFWRYCAVTSGPATWPAATGYTAPLSPSGCGKLSGRLAASAPRLDRTLRKIARDGGGVVLLDGSVIRTRRRTGAENRKNYAGRNKCHGLLVIALTDDRGRLLWISAARPGRTPEITACRQDKLTAPLPPPTHTSPPDVQFSRCTPLIDNGKRSRGHAQWAMRPIGASAPDGHGWGVLIPPGQSQ